jgi:hypothetical protein
MFERALVHITQFEYIILPFCKLEKNQLDGIKREGEGMPEKLYRVQIEIHKRKC